MIIEIAGPNAEAARESIAAVAADWGHPADAVPSASAAGPGSKGVDPVAVASLLLSIPSAALAVADITDRIRKRRRAGELIERARQLSAERATARLVHADRSVDLATLTPDQLLDLIADEPPTD
ncbi:MULTISPECIES: hypothetical protein [Kitasatospora]|uniref:Uncharacterized protein n=1 Tax=Kitasatospora setae (strain ATCC 33774 / DSM 43861 / JCM 3304 / KCC A-0304 / NBRC 14216 / KM-6054) TaxID=452652 RepID=E4N910_KITSK|nr:MULTISPECIES: hypothetical protein [Kitasatospora]BAJ27691.1 hypothetical protein KSE_18660 [Kitasatospora setae KM-6054]